MILPNGFYIVISFNIQTLKPIKVYKSFRLKDQEIFLSQHDDYKDWKNNKLLKCLYLSFRKLVNMFNKEKL